MSHLGSFNGVDLGSAPVAGPERKNANATYNFQAQKAIIQKQFASSAGPAFGL